MGAVFFSVLMLSDLVRLHMTSPHIDASGSSLVAVEVKKTVFDALPRLALFSTPQAFPPLTYRFIFPFVEQIVKGLFTTFPSTPSRASPVRIHPTNSRANTPTTRP